MSVLSGGSSYRKNKNESYYKEYYSYYTEDPDKDIVSCRVENVGVIIRVDIDRHGFSDVGADVTVYGRLKLFLNAVDGV